MSVAAVNVQLEPDAVITYEIAPLPVVEASAETTYVFDEVSSA